MRTTTLAAILCCHIAVAHGGQAQEGQPKPAQPAGYAYFEAEEFFSLQPLANSLEGFFGSGYRQLNQAAAPPVIDKTVFLFGNPTGSREYNVWVRAYTDGSTDRRVAVEWIGEAAEECTVRLKPTHKAGTTGGFHWERAGTVRGQRRKFYQLRLVAVDGSRPIVDAVLLTTDPKHTPKETVRPCEDADLTRGDGEGSTRVNRQTLVAGSDAQLEVVYTVGRSGIAEGGALRFFLPESWSPPQSGDSKQPGHVTARASRDGVRLAIDCHQPGGGAYAYSHELRHHHEAFVRLLAGSLQPGDTVTIHYAGQVQPYAQSAADFRNEVRAWYSPALPLGISTDAGADGIFLPVAPERSHSIEVIAGKPARLEVVVPSVVKVGEPLAINVAALDVHRNPATSYRGRLAFSLVALEKGLPGRAALPPPAELGPDDHGHKHLAGAVRLEQPGAFAIRVRDEAAGLEGISNPVRATREEPPYRIYWGDLHTHHRRCDGLRTFAEAALHARDVAGLDVVALSPHACYITDADLADLWRVDQQYHEPGRFVPLFAYEWAAGGQGASHSVVYSRTPMPRCFRAWGGGNVVRGRPALYEQLRKHKLDVVEVPHHVRGVTRRDPRYQKAIEIYSQWGSHEAGVAANFNDGLKACVFGASDNHTGQPGLQPISNRWAIHHHYGGLTAFLAPKLTRDELFKAIDARRCYATAACRIIAELKVDGHAMGEEFTLPSPARPRRIELEAVASTPIDTITLMRNGSPIRTWNPGRCVARLEHTDKDPYGGPTDFYYARLECGDVEKAWLTPVWVTYQQPVPSPQRRLAAAIEKGSLKNLAREKPVTTSSTETITHGRPELLTDGKLDNHFGHGIAGRAWVQIDLGAPQEIAFVRLWNYFRDGRTFHGNRLALSPTGEFAGEETVVFDSRKQGEYAETPRGRVFALPPVRARYVRSWLDSNTVNAGAQWVELEVYGPLPEAKEPAGPSGEALNRQAVSGTVTLDGVPLEQGTIEFLPRGQGRVASGTVIKRGRYEIGRQRGLPPGSYTVRISSPVGGPSGPPGSQKPPKDAPIRRERIPSRYGAQSQLRVEVQEGSPSMFDFDLKSE